MTNEPAVTVEPKSPASAFKFDPETKQVLMQMNIYLKNVSTVENIGVTQLVKDKKFRKEQSRLSMLVGANADSSRRSSVLPPILAERIEKRKVELPQVQIEESIRREKGERKGVNAFSSDSDKALRKINTSRQGNLNAEYNRYAVREETDERSYASASEVSAIQTAPSDDSSVSLNRYDVPSQRELGYDHITAQRSNDDEKQSQMEGQVCDTILSTRSLSTVSSKESAQHASSDFIRKQSVLALNLMKSHPHESPPSGEPLDATKKYNLTTPMSDSGFEMTLGQFESKMHPSVPGSVCSTSTSGSVAPWKDVRLKSVSSTSPGNQSETSKSSPQFAQLQLRRVDSSIVSTSSAASECHLRYSPDSKSSDFDESTSFISPSSNKQHHPTDNPAERTPPIQNSKPMFGSCSKKTDSESSVSVDNTLVSSADVCIRLRPNKGSISKVFVSKDQIRKTNQASEDAPLQVAWALDRSLIKSLSLDMADNQASLVFNEGRKTEKLEFVTAEDCLRFANSFYEFSASSTLRSTDSEIPNSVNQQDEDDDEVSLLDTLNDEEQKVLETYRRLRKTKAAEDAMQESISQETKRADDQISLTSEEDEQAEKYRGMLRMSFPLAVVKNKMTRDGVSSKIYAAIEATAKDSPPIFVSAQQLPGSPVSTFSSSCGHSFAGLETVETYRKQLDKLGNSEPIREQMKDNKIDTKIDAQASNEQKSKAESSLTSAEEALVQGYLKMLKMSVPEQAVRHKMLKDGASEIVVKSVFGEVAKVSSTTANTLNAEEMATANKFKKMLSMGVPKEGVRHKMIREQVSQKIIDAVLGAPSENTTNERITPPPAISTERDLTDDEMSLVSQYKKMLKLQIPREQVLSRMQKEGVGEKIITAVMGKRFSSSMSTSTEDSKTSHGTTSNLVSLHWTPLSGKDLDDSIWSRASKKRGISTKAAGPEKPEFNELMELFQKKANSGKIRTKKSQDSGKGSDKAKLLDITRSNNVAISLKAFKDFPFEELAEIISYLDPLRKIRGEKCQFLRDILPTSSEIRVIKEYDGNDERLEPAEIWFRHVVDIPRIDVKAQILRTMEMFNSEATLLMDSFHILNEVCHQVMRSEKLQDLLEMVLNIGNIMNEGTRTGGASGFKFDSLLKLTQTKSSDGKTTVLDFLVNVFASKNQREVLNLTSDFPRCRVASRMMISDLLKEVKNLGDSLEQCKEELETLIKEDERDNNETENDVVDLTAVNSSDLDDPRSALLSALKARGGNGHKKPKKFAQRDLFLAVVEEKKPKVINNKEVLDESMMNREAGINRLRRFIAEETETYACLIQKRDQALNACRETSKYCGEGGGYGSTAPLLGVLAQFADNLDDAVRKYDQKINREMRSKKQSNDQSCASSVQTCATGQTEAKDAKRSLILMVNEMLKDANERTKEDFTKGRVYGNPSKSLQAIYEREITVVSSVDTPVKEDTGDPANEVKEAEIKSEQYVDSMSKDSEGSSSRQPIEPSNTEKMEAQPTHIGQHTNCSISKLADFWKKKEVSSVEQQSLNDIKRCDSREDQNMNKSTLTASNPVSNSEPESQQQSEAKNLEDKESSLSKSPKRLQSIADAVKMFSGKKEKMSIEKVSVKEMDPSSAQKEEASSSPSESSTNSAMQQNDTCDNPTEESCLKTFSEDTAESEASVAPIAVSNITNDGDAVLVDSGIDLSSSRQRLSSSNLQEMNGEKENAILRDLARRLSSGKERATRTPETKANLGEHNQSGGILKTVQAPNLPMRTPSPTLASDKGESTVTRLARRKREEKAKNRKSLSEPPHDTSSPLPPSSEGKPAQQESVMVQMARQMRKEKRLSASKHGDS